MHDIHDGEAGTGPRFGPAPLVALSNALDRARTVEDVADALVQFGQPALNACVAVLALLGEDRSEFFCPRIAGYPNAVADAWRRFPIGAHLPIAEAVREGRAVLLESAEQRRAYYPPGTQLPSMVGQALAAVPMRAGEVVGGLGFTFPDDRPFDASDRVALERVAALCAGALARVRRGGLGCQVLVVEDEPAVLGMLDFALRYHAFTVHCASGGAGAVEVYRRHAAVVDVVLLDVQMPGMDGPQVLAALRDINPSVRCAFMSGNTGPYSGPELLALGAVGVLQKPFASLGHVIACSRTSLVPRDGDRGEEGRAVRLPQTAQNFSSNSGSTCYHSATGAFGSKPADLPPTGGRILNWLCRISASRATISPNARFNSLDRVRETGGAVG